MVKEEARHAQSETGEMARWVGRHIALAEDKSSIPLSSRPPITPVLGALVPSPGI